MSDKIFFTSLTRISDLDRRPFDCEARRREEWATGDYVLSRVVVARGQLARVELANGRMAGIHEGDLVVGALGVRYATLGAVGSWADVGPEGDMQMLTGAGLLGQATSVSRILPRMVSVRYEGHVVRDGEKVGMADFAGLDQPSGPYGVPTILIIGTSMAAGKTTAAQVVIRLLKRRGLRVVGCKLTGAGRYRDTLAMADAGADATFDFVDAGLPSSVCAKDEFRPHLRRLLDLIAGAGPDVVVAEAGASPCEPYNGDTVIEEIGAQVVFTILCASDPYAVVGVIDGFQYQPDVVAGLATSTTAGIELTEKITGVTAVNVLDPEVEPVLDRLLEPVLPS